MASSWSGTLPLQIETVKKLPILEWVCMGLDVQRDNTDRSSKHITVYDKFTK